MQSNVQLTDQSVVTMRISKSSNLPLEKQMLPTSHMLVTDQSGIVYIISGYKLSKYFSVVTHR
jgi:hypothetical protein